MDPVQQAHQNLRNLLLNGRILLNGQPPNVVEMDKILRGEQLLFEMASKLQAAEKLVADNKAAKEAAKKPPKSKEGK